MPSAQRTTGKDRSTPARYTLRAFKREESDEQGAMPREERHARRGQRGRNSRKKRAQLSTRQCPGDRGCGEKGKLARITGANRRRGRWPGVRRGRCDATACPGTVATDARGVFAGRRGLGGNNRLHPHQQQTEQDGGHPFHTFSLAASPAPRLNLFGHWLASFWLRLPRFSSRIWPGPCRISSGRTCSTS
jgi:hypothetical protein